MKHLFLILIISLSSCKHRETSAIEVIKFDSALIDSIKKIADTSYFELIGRSDFFTAEYYIVRDDSTQTKILKDSMGNIVCVGQLKNGMQTLGAEYYSNGQIKGRLTFIAGEVDGPATYYYSDGRIRTSGSWENLNQIGTWKEFSEDGHLKAIINYSDSGSVINKKNFQTEPLPKFKRF